MKKSIIIIILFFIVHNFISYLNKEVIPYINIPQQATEQNINQKFMVTEQKISRDIMDCFFKVSRITGKVQNVSDNLHKNIVFFIEIYDKNGVKIGTKEISISSLASFDTYKIDTVIGLENASSWKVRNYTSK